uniref:Uncharacterized protein n=1 Tax=Tetraselmis chuii TaxID=63592 RepID=A0A7S1SX18_9CHLO
MLDEAEAAVASNVPAASAAPPASVAEEVLVLNDKEHVVASDEPTTPMTETDTPGVDESKDHPQSTVNDEPSDSTLVAEPEEHAPVSPEVTSATTTSKDKKTDTKAKGVEPVTKELTKDAPVSSKLPPSEEKVSTGLTSGAVKFIDSSKLVSKRRSTATSVAAPPIDFVVPPAPAEDINAAVDYPVNAAEQTTGSKGAVETVEAPSKSNSDEAILHSGTNAVTATEATDPRPAAPQKTAPNVVESESEEEEDDEYVMMIETADGDGAETAVAMTVKKGRDGQQLLWDDDDGPAQTSDPFAAENGVVDGRDAVMNGVSYLPIHVESEADLAPLREQRQHIATDAVMSELFAAPLTTEASASSSVAAPAHPTELNPVKRPGTVGKRPVDSELLIPNHGGGGAGFKPLPIASGEGLSAEDSNGHPMGVQRISFDGGPEALPPVRPPSSLDNRRNSHPHHHHQQHQRPGSRLGNSDDGESLPKMQGPPLDPPGPLPASIDRHRKKNGFGKSKVASSGEALRRSEGDPSLAQSSGTPSTGKRERFVRKPSLSESLRASGPPPRPPPGHIGAMSRRASLPGNVPTVNSTGNGRRKGDGGKEKKAALPPVSIPVNGGRRASISAVSAVTRMHAVVGSSGRVRVNRFPTLAESMGKAAQGRGGGG